MGICQARTGRFWTDTRSPRPIVGGPSPRPGGLRPILGGSSSILGHPSPLPVGPMPTLGGSGVTPGVLHPYGKSQVHTGSSQLHTGRSPLVPLRVSPRWGPVCVPLGMCPRCVTGVCPQVGSCIPLDQRWGMRPPTTRTTGQALRSSCRKTSPSLGMPTTHSLWVM